MFVNEHTAADDKNNGRKFKVLLLMNYHFHVLIMSNNCFGIFADDALCVAE
jgi:hypothetical protein